MKEKIKNFSLFAVGDPGVEGFLSTIERSESWPGIGPEIFKFFYYMNKENQVVFFISFIKIIYYFIF